MTETFCYNTEKSPGFLVADANHPLSLGYTVQLYTENQMFEEKSRCSKAQMKHFVAQVDMGTAQAYACEFSGPRKYAIWLTKDIDSKLRMIELISHEVSHIVDYMMNNACIFEVHTELRAYHIDWLVGS
jgi:wobble nucleotide-excising tRNase